MSALTEKHTGGTVQLRNHNAFGTVYYKRALLGHIRDRTEINILDCCCKILVVGICTIKFELSLEGNTIRETTFKTLIY